MEDTERVRLEELEADRAKLERALGFADAEMVVAMVRSLEEQLVELYRAMDESSEEFEVYDGEWGA